MIFDAKHEMIRKLVRQFAESRTEEKDMMVKVVINLINTNN